MAETFGRKPLGDDVGWGQTSAGVARGSIMGRPALNGRVYLLAGRLGRYESAAGSNPLIRLAIYGTTGGTTVGNILGQTAAFTVSAFMRSSDTGADYLVKPTAPIKVYSAQTYALAALGTGYAWSHGQDNSGHTMHERGGLAALPSPFGSTNTRPEGKMSLWAMIQANRKPLAPSGLSPTPGSYTSDSTPTLACDFRDPDETLPGYDIGEADKVSAWRFEVWNTALTTRLRDSGKVPATAAQQTARRVSWDVPTALPAASYIARATVWDDMDSPSVAKDWAFQVNAGGALSNPVIEPADTYGEKPTGEEVTGPNPRMSATYGHAGALSGTHYQMVVWNSAGTIVQGPTADIALAVAPGAVVTQSPIGAGLAALTAAQKYTLGMRVKDSGGLYTPWAKTPLLQVNAAPTAPGSMLPAPNATFQSPPELSVISGDPSDDKSRLTTTFYVRAQGDLGAGVAIPSSYSGDRHRAQTTTAQLTAKGIWEWQARSQDEWGALGPLTAWQAFTYADPPVVTITSPAEGATIATGTPSVDFTSSVAMSTSRLQIRDVDTGAIVHDSGDIATAGTGGSRSVPAAVLRANRTYDLIIDVTSTVGLVGTESNRVTLVYPAVAALASLTAEQYAGPYELPDLPAEWSRYLFSWPSATTTEAPDNEFLGYILRRINLATGEAKVVAFLEERASTTWIDKTMLSGVAYRYEITILLVRNTIDQIESAPAIVQATLYLRNTVIASLDADDIGYPLRFWESREAAHTRDVQIVPTFGPKPVAFMGPARSRILQGSFMTKDTAINTAQEIVEAAVEAGSPVEDADGRIRPRVCYYRDPRGRGMAVVASAPIERDDHNTSRARIDQSFTEIEATVDIEGF